MRRFRLRTAASLAALTLAAGLLPAPAAARRPPHGNGPGTLLVGTASRTVLPTVDGGHAYLAAGLPGPEDAGDPGVLVPAWDDGRIAVGNGEDASYWVHDDLRVTALAIDDPRSRHLVVLVSSDLYMIFRFDAEAIRTKAAALLPPGLARRARIVVTATHNHHGPDTAWDVNHDWYEYMTDQAARAVAAAVRARRPATLRVAAGEHWFGQNDGTDPQILDPRLQVLQARDTRGRVIATAVQWNNHPEGTLGWSPPVEAIADDCVVLGLTGGDCDAEGRYFTSDYPGAMRRVLHDRYGGEVLFFNGALGVIIGPGGAQVWEVTPEHPLGNQLIAPAGATAAGGGTDYTQRNFRRTEVIGEQLAQAVIDLLGGAERLRSPRVSYQKETFFARLTNIGFRALLTVDPATGFTALGHTPARLYTCPATGAKDETTCTDDGFAAEYDDIAEMDIRVGDHGPSAVEYVRIGPVGMMFLPGEIPGELTIGLPADFRTTPENWYEEPPGRHAFGDDYTTPGYVINRMHDRYEWTVGLGSDELGYVIPISNFRVMCVADEFAGEGLCALLHSFGYIDFPDSLAGTTCKGYTDDPSTLTFPEPIYTAVWASCRYGQALGEADGHYEETNSASWDLAQAMLDAVAALTGDDDPAEVNPDFPGWWEGHLPPG